MVFASSQGGGTGPFNFYLNGQFQGQLLYSLTGPSTPAGSSGFSGAFSCGEQDLLPLILGAGGGNNPWPLYFQRISVWQV
jgi:hypothetical protein